MDVLSDIAHSLAARPLRSLLLLTVFAVGSGGFLTSVGVGSSAALQVTERITPKDLDYVTVRAAVPDGTAWPVDTLRRTRALPKVLEAGFVWPYEDGGLRATRFPDGGRSGSEPLTSAVAEAQAATPGYLHLAGAVTYPAQALRQFDGPAGDHVALVGRAAAQRLGVSLPGPGVQVWVNQVRYDVVGIIESAAHDPRLVETVVISGPGLGEAPGKDAAQRLVLRTVNGYAGPVSQVVAVALRPDRPSVFTVDPVIDLANLRRGVNDDLNRIIGGVAVVVLLIGGLMIANVLIVSVLTRQSEIGLRRALGATRGSVARLFLGEAVILAALGGLFGVGLGTSATVVICLIKGWEPVIEAWMLPAAPVTAMAVAVMASLYPTWRATRVEPSLAVRAGG